MERWAKLFEIKGVQVLATTGEDDDGASIDFTVRGPGGQMTLKLVCRGDSGEDIRDFMFGDLNADITDTFLCRSLGQHRDKLPNGFVDAFTRPVDPSFEFWMRPMQKGGKFDA